MELSRQVEVEEGADALRALRRYFVQRRYALASEEPLAWRRGSRLGTLFGQSPARWRVDVGAELEGGRLTIRFAARTTGQLVTETERRFWEAEADGAAAAAGGQEVAQALEAVEGLEVRARKQAHGVMGWTLAGAALLGTGGLALSVLGGGPALLPAALSLAGAALGGAVGGLRARRRS